MGEPLSLSCVQGGSADAIKNTDSNPAGVGWTSESASNKLSGDADHNGLRSTLSKARLMRTSAP